MRRLKLGSLRERLSFDLAGLMQLVRFVLVGGATTLLYAALALGLIFLGGLRPLTAHLIAYAIAVPVSFLGQKFFTFRFAGDQQRALRRFLASTLAALLLSTVGMALVVRAELPSYSGILLTMASVPATSYLMMALWVFTDEGA